MKVFNSLEEISGIEATAVALGNFDGIHRGHQALIEEAVRSAGERGLRSAVFTFSNHPRNVLAGRCVVKNLIYADEKIRLLEQAGIDYMFSVDFNDYIMCRTPEEFVDDILIRRFNMKTAVCGFNFTYGFKAAGTPERLKEYTAGRGIDVRVIDPVTVDGEVVSSTRIRELIAEGDMERVSRLMGRDYMIRGEIVRGNQSPKRGAYVTRSLIEGTEYPSMTNVGRKPTIGEYQTNVETHIFDFDQDVYGKQLEVSFLRMIRPEAKFSGLDALKDQLGKDCAFARSQHSI